MKRRILGLVLSLVLLLSLSGCQQKLQKPQSRSGVALDTVVNLTVYSDDERDEMLDVYMKQIEQYEALFSRTNPDSDISRINAAKGEWVTVDEVTVDLLRRAVGMSEKTDGAFDITVAPVVELWDFTGDDPTLPDEEAVKAAAALVDYTGIEIDGRRVRLKDPAMALDVGGIAKGYIADIVGEGLFKSNDGVIVDLGGNILTMGRKNGEPFTVGVRDPFDPDGLAATLSVTQTAVVTSGVYERGFDLDGVRYHHILDPATGYPVQNGLVSVTIRASRAVEADAFSTACFVMGEEKGLDFIRSTAGVEALFIRADGTQVATSGFWE